MSQLAKLYTDSVLFSFFAKLINVLSALGILWLLNAFMGKEVFGVFILAFTICLIISAIFSTGIQYIVLYRISRLDAQETENETLQHELMGQALLICLLFGSMVCFSVYCGAPYLSHWGKPELGRWLSLLAPFILVDMLNWVLTGWYQAKQRIPTMIMHLEIYPNILRVLFLGLIWLMDLNTLYAALAYFLATFVPLSYLYIKKPFAPLIKKGVMDGWDYKYGSKVMLTQLQNQPAKSIDLIFVGFLASAIDTANYAMALRLALFLWMGKFAVQSLFRVRIGRLLETKDNETLKTEYRQTQIFSYVFGLCGVLAFTLFGPYILPIFGDYDAAFPILLLLCGVIIVRMTTGMAGEYLLMAGYAGWTFISTTFGLLLFIFAGWFLILEYGALGGVLAMLVSAGINNILISIIILMKDRFVVTDLATFSTTLITLATLFMVSFDIIHHLFGSGILALILAFYLWVEAKYWRPLLAIVLPQKGQVT